MGDRILKVNGSEVKNATHQEAVMELLRPCDDIQLTIQHDPLPAGFQVTICQLIPEKCFASTCTAAFLYVEHKPRNQIKISLFLSLFPALSRPYTLKKSINYCPKSH